MLIIMARITVQKAVEKIGNRFDLVIIASFRSRQIQLSIRSTLLNNNKNDKPTILALREIEKNLINKCLIKKNFY